MSVSVIEHLIYKLRNVQIRAYPYPHLYIDSIFPNDFYQKLRKCWPLIESMKCIADTGRTTGNLYRERFILPLEDDAIGNLDLEVSHFWHDMASWLLGNRFKQEVMKTFESYFPTRFGKMPARLDCTPEALIVRDLTNYSISPHTDTPSRLLSLLFYCPQHNTGSHLGTSIYIPKDPGVELDPKLHHSLELFNRISTMEYRPNSLFAFLRTDHSYHGVETITAPEVERDLLLYDIRLQKIVMPAAKQKWQDRMISRLFK